MGLRVRPSSKEINMLKEVCFEVERTDGVSPDLMFIGALPVELHSWFTTEVLDIGNGDYDRILTPDQIGVLESVIVSWHQVNELKRIMEPQEAAALETTLMFVERLHDFRNIAMIRFSNFSRGDKE